MENGNSTKSLLVVDDEQAICKMLRFEFQDRYEVTTANDVSEAIEKFHNHHFDVIITDLRMPSGSGLDFIRSIDRSRLPPTILMTGHGDKTVAIDAIRHGVADFVEKPINMSDLATIVHRLSSRPTTMKMLSHAIERAGDAHKLATIGTMTTSILHEINGALAVIDGRTTLLGYEAGKNRHLESKRVLEYTKVVLSMCERIGKVSKSIRNLSRSDSGSDDQTCTLEEVFEDTFDLCTPLLKDRGVKLFAVALKHVYNIRGDRIKISNVLVNLIKNAAEAIATLEDKWVEIQAFEPQNGFIQIRVVDSGTSMTPAKAEKIFEPFFTTKKVGEGTGVGLSISRQFIEEIGGKLQIDAFETNTTFVVDLPLAQANHASDNEQEPA